MKNQLLRFGCLVIGVLFQFSLINACPDGSVVYVRASASGTNDGTSWTNAFTKVQDALAASCGCPGPIQIWVASGTYYPDEGVGQTNNLRTSTFLLCNNVGLYGGFIGTETLLGQRNYVSNVTTLSGDIDQVASATNNAYHVLTGSGTNNTATLDGFTVSGGNANGGGSNNNGGGLVNLSGSPTLRNLRFTTNNATTLGGAIHNSISSPVILNTTFITNTCALVGGAINAEVSSHVTLIDCDFISNTGTINGGALAVSQSNPILRDCRFIGNTSQEGGAVYAFRMVTTITNCLFSGNRATNRGAALHLTTDTNSKLLNCTLSGNHATGNGGAILLWNTPNLTVINTIIHNNRAAGSITSTSASIFRDNATATFSYSLVANSGGSGAWVAAIGTNGGNNIDANPQFVTQVDPLTAPTTAGNLALTSFSPALNIGSNTAYDVVGDPQNDLDLANNPRVFEYLLGGIIDMGPYEFQGQSACTGAPVVYVKATASGSNNGSSWSNAYTKLQDALAAACTCGTPEIWVATGTYYPDEGIGQTDNNRNSSFTLCSGVKVYGGFAGTETMLSQRNWVSNVTTLSGNIDGLASTTGDAYHVVLASNTNSATLMDGFTITKGNANGASSPTNKGGGIYKENGAAKFQHMYFTLNLAVDGASCYSQSGSSTMTDCTFENNQGTVVIGGVNNQASPAVYTRCHFINNFGGIETAAVGNTACTVTFVDCSFVANLAGVGNGNAGAVHSWASTVNFYNCLFSGNKATRNGGAIFNTNTTVCNITNCTFSGNSTTLQGGAIFNEQNAVANVKNSIIWNNRAGSSTTTTSASIFNSTASTNVYYSLVANSGGSGAGWQAAIGVDGGNNIASDPVFVQNVDPATAPTLAGNLHVQSGSPAINAGNNAYNGYPTDYDGNTRIEDDVIDMGAFEFPCIPVVWYADTDEDGFGDPDDTVEECEQPSGYVSNQDDCDDTNSEVNPTATESCNGIDDDCDGLVDEGVLTVFYEDEDGDGFGDADSTVMACALPDGYVENDEDCDDSSDAIYPGAQEVCNGIDDDCDGLVDGDDPDVTGQDTWYLDADSDGYGDETSFIVACEQPEGYVDNAEDCDDDAAEVHPGAQEMCDGMDNDCDGLVDDADPGITGQDTWYLDADGDTYGDAAVSQASCTQPSGYVLNSQDCNDSDDAVHPGAPESCNEVDDDCDGMIDEGLNCGIVDGDGDGVDDALDNCPEDANPTQSDSDCDGVGDACDVCPGGDDTIDQNGDGLPDCFYLPAYVDMPAEWICAKNKVLVSHIGANGSCTTLCLSYNAAQAHLNHGDHLGPCNDAVCPPAMVHMEENETEWEGNFQHEDAHQRMDIASDLRVVAESGMIVYPNPSGGEFYIELGGDVRLPATLRVYNELAQLLLQMPITQTSFVLNLGDHYPAGSYWLAIQSADEIRYVKVVKM